MPFINVNKFRRILTIRTLGYKYYSDVKTTTAIPQTQTQSPPAPGIGMPSVNVSQTVPIKGSPIIRNVLTTEIPASTVDPTTAPFDSIPGPTSLRLISKFWHNFPMISTEFTAGTVFHVLNLGKFFGNILSWGGNAKFFQKFFNVYGPVVRLHGPFGGDVVLLSRPEHASVVFQCEGQFPLRSCLDSVEKYRLEYRKLRTPGPFLGSGSEWQKLHKSLELPMHNSVSQHYEKIEKACDEFVSRIVSIRNLQEEVPKSFNNEILKWCLECMCSVALNRRLGFLDPCGLSPTSDPGRLLEGINGATEAIRKCEYGFHVWKFMETPAWKSLVKNCDSIDSVLNKYVIRSQNMITEKKESIKASDANFSIVESLLLRDDILSEDVMTVLLDMMLIGVNATGHTVAFLLYHLSKSPRSQKRLYDEIQKQQRVTKETLKCMRYLQACIKESLRLTPPIPILNRVLHTDAVIHNYRIPKGTYVLMATHLASLREEYFEDADKFLPERWLAPDYGEKGNEFQGFASIPFGYGPKACLARDLAEIEVGLLLTKVIRKFKIEYNYGEIQSSNVLLAAPTKPLNFRFIDRL